MPAPGPARSPTAPSASAPPRTSASITSRNFSASTSCTFPTRRSEEHTSELQSRLHLVCRLLLEKKKTTAFCAAFAKLTCETTTTSITFCTMEILRHGIAHPPHCLFALRVSGPATWCRRVPEALLVGRRVTELSP